jgi:hypothetical protein
MIDVLVPVLRRPWNAQPLVDSAQNTAGEYRLIFICSLNDHEQIAACHVTGAEVWVTDWKAGRGDFARKINWAYERSDAEWFFQGADDIRFGERWDEHALQTARTTGRRVIGTNDLHNPNVRRQRSSTHTLIARSYIEVYGGTKDDTGRVFCELYDHQYVDNEFIETAKVRNEWAFSKDSIVEHLHPHWGLAEMDHTYLKATRQTMADRRLYQTRMGRHTLAQERMERRRALRAGRG